MKISLAAFQPEPLELEMPNGEIYVIPGSVPVSFMTKLMSLQEKTKSIGSEENYVKVLQDIAFEILSLDKSKNLTLEKVKEDLDDLILLIKIPLIFNDHIQETVKNSLPKSEDSPNAETPKA